MFSCLDILYKKLLELVIEMQLVKYGYSYAVHLQSRKLIR